MTCHTPASAAASRASARAALAQPTRRAALAAVGATLAAPWVGARASSIAGGRSITLVVSYPAGGAP
jgi:hypothetical protein